MKPVPFAQYLERQHKSATQATSGSVSWPPREMKSGGIEKPRQSPLLRRVESEKTDGNAASQRVEQNRLLAFEEGRESARRELEDQRGGLREELEKPKPP